MKAFTFRLEQALRWRESQVNLQKSRVTAAAARLPEIEATLETARAELTAAAAWINNEPTGSALLSYAVFRERSSIRIRDSEAQALLAQRTLMLEMNRLLEASRRVRLIQNLKQTARGQWNREFDRELAAFADEAFLGRLQSKTEPTGA